MIVSDAPSCGVTYDCHSDDSSGFTYDRNMFIVQATDYLPRSQMLEQSVSTFLWLTLLGYFADAWAMKKTKLLLFITDTQAK